MKRYIKSEEKTGFAVSPASMYKGGIYRDFNTGEEFVCGDIERDGRLYLLYDIDGNFKGNYLSWDKDFYQVWKD